ncbi:MAG: hypothetical protein FWE87_05840, partial [Coriobacteriia bacterium]|nr:hypothetical protein [Coriobacteriia bacterium]
VGEPVEFVEFTEPVEVVEIAEPVEVNEDVEVVDKQIPPIASPTLEDEPVAPSSFLKTKLPLILSIIGGLMLLAILLLSLATCTGLLGNNADIDPNSTLGTIIEDFSDDGLIEGDVLGIGE